jgi:hypothetical protein
MISKPRINAMIAIVIMRRRIWGTIGRSPFGRNFLYPF